MLPQVLHVNVTRTATRRPHATAPALRMFRAGEPFAAKLAALRPSALARAAAPAGSRPVRFATTPSRMASAHAPPTATRAAIDAWLRTPRQRALADAITRASDHAGVEPSLSLAVAVAESSLNPAARSADGLSSGTFQVTGPTASDIRRRFRSGDLARPPGNDDVALGVAHLRYLDDLFARDASLGRELRTVAVDDDAERRRFAVAAYNAGEGRVARAQERAAALRRDPTRFESIRAFLPAITQRYVERVMRYAGRDTVRTQSA